MDRMDTVGFADCFCKLTVARCVISFHFESWINSEIAIGSKHGGLSCLCGEGEVIVVPF